MVRHIALTCHGWCRKSELQRTTKEITMRNIFKRLTPILLGAALIATAASAAYSADNNNDTAWAGKWLVRGRLLGVLPDVGSSSTTIGGHVDVKNSVVPEVDASYFFTDHIAAELIAATTRHAVTATNTTSGNVNVGHAWLLPPTLTVQYHFTQFNGFKPYVGAGVNYTLFYSEKPGALSSVKYDNSFGPALQAGVDVPLGNSWYFNADVKRVWISTTAKFNGGAIKANVDINPWLAGVGFGYRF